MSMAAGEYVSVHSQADAEQADIDRERQELKTDSASEHRELATIYQRRGLDPVLAQQVADQLMAHDALGAHMRDELGILQHTRARPLQAALASATCFAIGAAFPLLIAAQTPARVLDSRGRRHLAGLPCRAGRGGSVRRVERPSRSPRSA